MKTFLRFLGAVGAFFAVTAAGVALSACLYPDSDTPGWFISATLVLASAVCLWLMIRALRKSAGRDSARPDRTQPRPLFSGRFIHVSGLNLPPDTPCLVRYFPQQLSIGALGQNFILKHSRVRDVSVNTITELEERYISSAGGAVAGAMVFGPLGALIGGRTKKRLSRRSARFLIFAYDGDDGSVRYIVLRFSAHDMSVRKFLRAYKKQGSRLPIDIEL